MNRWKSYKLILLFFLFFSFQWFAQYAALKLSQQNSTVFFILMYSSFFLRSLIWVEILRDMKLISAYSLTSLSYLIIPVLSWLIAGESYKISYLVGGILILAGIIIFNMGDHKLRILELEGV